MEDKYKFLFINIIVFGVGVIGSRLVLFALLPIYTVALSSSEYGIAELVVTISQLLLPIASFAIYNGLLRFGLSVQYKREEVVSSVVLVFLIGSIFVFLITPIFDLYEPVAPWKWYICTYVVSYFFWNVCFIYLKVKNENKIYSILSIVQAFLLTGLNIVLLLFLDLGIHGFLLSTSLSYCGSGFLAFIFSSLYKDLKAFKINIVLFKDILKYSAPFILNDIFWWVIHASDKIMLEQMINSSALGIYALASKMPALINVLASIFNQAWNLSAIKEYEDKNENSYYEIVFRNFYTVFFGACFIINIFIKDLLEVFVSQSFVMAWKYVPLLMVSAVFGAISSYTTSLYSAFKKSNNIMVTTALASLINITVNFLFIPYFGIWGAVLGTVASSLSVAYFRLWNLQILTGIKFIDIKFMLICSVVVLHTIILNMSYCNVLVQMCLFMILLLAIRKEIYNFLEILKQYGRA